MLGPRRVKARLVACGLALATSTHDHDDGCVVACRDKDHGSLGKIDSVKITTHCHHCGGTKASYKCHCHPSGFGYLASEFYLSNSVVLEGVV